jgi:predicted amidohydrolase YtcJ
MTGGSLLIENCRVLNAEGKTPHRSILVEDGRITRLSDDATQTVPAHLSRLDAGGGTAVAGLIDSHCHPVGLGELRRILDLGGTTNVTSVRLRLFATARKAPPGEWILGRGWDHEALTERRYLTKSDVDDLTPENPLFLRRVCGHVALLNSRALKQLSLADSDASLDRRFYERDSSGRLSGIIKEIAIEKATREIPAWTPDVVAKDILTAEFEAARSGLTTLHCILSNNFRAELAAFERLSSEGKLALRYRLFVPLEAADYVDGGQWKGRFDPQMVRINGVKLYADGSLGARTAALREPYSDEPDNTGILRHSPEELRELAAKAASRGHQVIIHAIGDRAVEESIDAIEAVSDGGNKRRHRIEHASVCDGEMVGRLKRLQIGVTVQPHFIVSDTWAEERLGPERLNWLYPLRTLLAGGVVASGSSDSPVEPVSPLLGIWAAMVRAGFAEKEKLILHEALKMYTKNGAWNGFDEESLGEIREGALADLTVLDSDIEGMHPAMLRKVGVAATVVNGQVAYSYEGAS